MKRCTKCGVEKPATTEFFEAKRKGSRDGFHSWCRACHNAAHACYQATHPEARRATYARYKATHLEARKAKTIARRAVDRGQLIRPDACERCGKPSSQLDKHHEDYSRPLEVKFLCRRCHKAVHRAALQEV
jgi:hypothetical protein